MTHYMVVTPEYGAKIPILDDGSGPMEYGCDVFEVEAPNARQAKVQAVQYWRTHPYDAYHKNGWLDEVDGNPFTGLKALNVATLGGEAEELGNGNQKRADD
jgi:hypothetical protein